MEKGGAAAREIGGLLSVFSGGFVASDLSSKTIRHPVECANERR
ncbi:hypothetical protein SBA3_1180007 [Candidatus Sulfopaludibacter sp. SbA3]|nr:hypothetical protein SBA3_1180007 [Candidatus Sulfopaludibacter sp. SbA3]